MTGQRWVWAISGANLLWVSAWSWFDVTHVWRWWFSAAMIGVMWGTWATCLVLCIRIRRRTLRRERAANEQWWATLQHGPPIT